MNTVLDDNKVLCLMNSDKIQMSSTMTLMFETDDLSKASPATVSRCGMVYLPDNIIGTKNFYLRWLESHFVDLFNPSMMDHMIDLYDLLFKKSSKYIHANCKSYHEMTEMIYVVNFVRMLELLMKEAGLSDSRVTEMEFKTFSNKVNICFVMALSLTLGVLVKDEFRKPFDKFLRRAVSEPIKSEINHERILNFDRNVSPPEIQGALMIDYYLDFEDWKWHAYKDQITRISD